MKTTLLLLASAFAFVAHTQFHAVPATKILFPASAKVRVELAVESCSVSNLVTVAEFKNYLAAVQKDSSATFYNAQIPLSGRMNKELVQAILNDNQLQNKPMPGVSWTVARNYCKWLTAKAQTAGDNCAYDLPALSQLVAFDNLYQPDPELESWVLDVYDESMAEIGPNLIGRPHGGYFYDVAPDDPPALKRKSVYGGSYRMDYKPHYDYNQARYDYQDSCSRYIGFRVVRTTKANSQRTQPAKRGTINLKGNQEAVEPQKPVVEENSDKYRRTVTIDGCITNFSIERNHFHGVYEEQYPNGKIKVAGQFLNGQRTGMWSVWDSTGTLLLQRDYINNKHCELVYPKTDNPYETLYAAHPVYVEKRNEFDFIPYHFVAERDVSYSMRTWRQLTTDNEFYFFELVYWTKFIRSIIDSDAKWFAYGNSADFKRVITGDSLATLKNGYTNWDFSRIEIKEDFFYSAEDQMANTRQLAMSFYTTKDDKMPVYTLYIPQIRKQMAAVKLTLPGYPSVKNLDDILYLHAYRGEIVWRSSVFDRGQKALNDWDEEIIRLMGEHDQWMAFGR